MLSFLTLVLLLFAIYWSTFLLKLGRNYVKARNSGFPIVILPFDPGHLVWMIISVPLRPWLARKVPYSIFWRLTLGIYGWEFHEKRKPFRRLNTDSFMLVTCGKNELWTVDREIVHEMLKRPGEFVKTDLTKVVMDTFGTSVLTSEGETWARQRKLITGIINERISRVVFEETWKQSRGMVRDIEAVSPKGETGSIYPATFPSLKRIASNVLFRSAYGLPQEFKEPPKQQKKLETSGSKRELDMLDCIDAVIMNLVPAGFLHKSFLLGIPSWLPLANWAHHLGAAVDQFPGLVKKRLDEERIALKTSRDGEVRSNLTSMLIQASEYGNDEGTDSAKATKEKQNLTLSTTELSGNLFIFTTAGFETTANALTFALVSLMTQPEIQDWLFEEIDDLFANVKVETGKDSDEETIEYIAFYPKAIRCLALLMETLRFYPPVIHLTRQTLGDRSTEMKTSKKTYSIPKSCIMFAPLPSLHCDPEVWRDLNLRQDAETAGSENPRNTIETAEDVAAMTQDEYAFRPSRWVNEGGKQTPNGPTTRTLYQPIKGSYAPFSGGPRICPGQKMAQVEFVCVILTLFREYKIEAVKQPGEDDEALRRRLQQVLKDCHSELTLVIDRLGEIDVKFTKREKSYAPST